MKAAKEILTKVANEHSYEDWGECMYDTHPHSQIEYAVQAMQEYARIQIEKDREDAALKASEFGIGYNQIKIEQAIKDRPITLD
jgi:hypothetical protein